MAKTNKKPAILIILTLISIISANIIFYAGYFNPDTATAEIRDGGEKTANASTAYSAGAPSIASDPEGGFVSVWQNSGTDGDGYGIFMQRFDRFGTRLGNSDIQVNSTTAGNQNNPDIVMDKNGNFIVVWSGNGSGGDSNGIYARAYKKDGTAIADETRLNTTGRNEDFPKIAIDYDNDQANGAFVVTWESAVGDSENHEVYAQRCAVNFEDAASPITLIGNEINVSDDPAIITASDPVVAMTTNGDFMIAWKGKDTTWSSADQGWFQAYDKNGAKVGSYTKATSSAILSIGDSPGAIAVDKKARTSFGGDFILVASAITPEFPNGGVFARQINCSESSCSLNPISLKVFTHNRGGSEDHPSVDMDAFGNFTITWQGYDPSNDTEIYAQNYSWNNGLPIRQITRVGGEFRVNSTTVGPQEAPAISMTGDGRYTIVYSSGSADADIKYQMFTSNLFKDGPETPSHPSSPINQYGVDTAVAPGGYHAATWVNASGPRGIYFTLWDPDNNVIAENIRVDSDDPSNVDDNPSISFFKDTTGSGQGRFVIAWEGVAPACAGIARGTDVLYREINSSGIPQGPCESSADNLSLGDQSQPDIAAGYYNNDGGQAEDTFTLIYFDGNDAEKKVQSAFHFTDFFTYNEIAGSCDAASCLKTAAILNPASNRIVYAWDNADDFRGGVFLRQASAGTLIGSANLQVNPAGTNVESYPDLAFLPDDQFIVTYEKTTGGNSRVFLKRFLFNASGNPSVIDEEYRVGAGTELEQTAQYYPKIAADPVNGDFIVTWSHEIGENRIFAQFFEYANSGTGGIPAFGRPFLVNSTRGGTSTLPSTDMDSYGHVTVAWEGTISQASFVDNNGIATQRLKNPLYIPPAPDLRPTAEQVITGGGRTMTVPSSIQYPAATVSTTGPSEIQASIRAATCGGNPFKYLEVTDLDGAPFTITAAIENDFTLTPPGATSYIPKGNASVRNWDQNTADTNADCSDTTKSDCVLTINSSSENTSFNLSGESEDFATLDEQRTMVDKSGENEIGKWRFYPEFMLNIPARTPPGNHATEIIFTLT